jgi:hypothetical protein
VEPPYPLIWKLIKQGRVVPFLGAGASLGQRPDNTSWRTEETRFFPSGRELSEWLANMTNFPSASEYDRSDLAKVASYFYEVNGKTLLYAQLHDVLDRQVDPGPLHKFLASLDAPQVIVSTNFDTLIEQAFLAAKKPFDLVVYLSDNKEQANTVLWWGPDAKTPQPVPPNQLNIDLSTRTVIFKMHGTVDRGEKGKWDNYVITEEDYIDFLSRMTTSCAVPAIFFDHFRERNFLFLGYSLRDWNFRVILKNLGQRLDHGEDMPSWAIQKGASEFDKVLWSKRVARRAVNIYDLTVEDFVTKLVANAQQP